MSFVEWVLAIAAAYIIAPLLVVLGIVLLIIFGLVAWTIWLFLVDFGKTAFEFYGWIFRGFK